MGPIGMQEMIAIFVIALVLFGPKKLPELGRLLGKGLSEFRRAKSELKATFETHLQELERETRDTQTPTTTHAIPAATTTDYSAPPYSYPYEDQGTWETGNSSATVPPEPVALEHAEPHPVEPAVSHPLPVAGTVPRGHSTFQEEHSA